MKLNWCIFFTLIFLKGYAQSEYNDSVHLSVSPLINQGDSVNRQIIKTLGLFLQSKDSSYSSNRYWAKADFEKYIYPYADLNGIEAGKAGRYFYEPSVMEIIPTKKVNQKIVKIAFIGHTKSNGDNVIKAIYNIIANNIKNQIIFSSYLNYISEDWEIFREGSVSYKIPPGKSIKYDEVLKQKTAIKSICKFLHADLIPITYYSCRTVKEAFELKGFDYNAMMYVDTSGGFAMSGDIVVSGNNSEYYLHEICHLYTSHLFPGINNYFNEGFATLLGGSGNYSYQWHRNKFKKFLEERPDFMFDDEIRDPFERLYYENETPIPYLAGALICERILRLYGKDKLFELFRSGAPIIDALRTVGLTKENMNAALRKEIQLQPIVPF